MFGRRISFLLPFSIIQLCFASEDKHLPKRPLITDDEIQEDMKAVDLAIQAPWVERNPSGVERMETKRESFGLNDAQKALFNRHWELETIQLEKPEAPKQVNLELLAEALDIAMEMKPDDKQVLLKMDKLNEWANEEEGNTKIVEDNSKAKLSSNLTKSIEEEKKEAKEDYITLSELFKLDEKEEIKEEIKEEEQCSEKDKQKFLEGKSIESPIQQQNRTETIFENINGISGNWWHFATDTQPIEEKKIENKDDQPAFVMVVLDEGNEDEEKEKKKVDKEENLKKEEDKVEKEKKEEDKAENEVKKVIEEALIKSILEESNENEVFAQIQKQKELRAERPSEMVIIDMTSNEDSYKKSEERKIEDKIEAEKDEQKEQQMMDIIEVINMDKESDEDEDDNSSPLEEKIEEEEKSSGILGVLSNLLFGGRRFKREAFPFPAIPNSTKIVDPFEVNSGEKIESMKIIKSFAGRMNMGGKDIEFSSTKWEVTKDLGKKEEENKEVLKENLDNELIIENAKQLEKMKEMNVEEKKMDENEKTKNEGSNEKNVGEKEKINEKAKIAKYLSEMLSKTSDDRPKRNEKIAYVWYCELQYWLAKRVENDFKGNKNDSGNVAKILDEMDIIMDELEFVRSKWGKVLGKLAELTDFIGKEFKRRK